MNKIITEADLIIKNKQCNLYYTNVNKDLYVDKSVL